jgi:hypothetical protein
VTVALNHLRRNRRGFQSQTGADFFFQFRREMGKDTHRAGKLSHAHIFGSGGKTGDVALRFRIPVGEFKAEGDGFGVDAVRASHHGRVFEFPGAAFQHVGQALPILAQSQSKPAGSAGLARYRRHRSR